MTWSVHSSHVRTIAFMTQTHMKATIKP